MPLKLDAMKRLATLPSIRVMPALCSATLAFIVLTGCSGVAEPDARSITPTTEVIDTGIILPSQTPASTPTATSTPVPDCWFEPGQVLRTTYAGRVVQDDVPLMVYLPPCYDERGDAYPVLYLLHGFGSGMDETHWEQLGVVAEADSRFEGGEALTYIMVMPLQPDPIFINSMGGPGSYEQEMLEGVIPVVEARYRTHTGPEGRVVAGISRGGVWALELAFRNPDVFNTVAALSPALHLNYAFPEYDPLLLAAEADQLPKHIMLMAGDAERDFRNVVLELSATLQERGVVHVLEVGTGGHENETWSRLIPLFMDFVADSLGGAADADHQR